MLSFLLETVLFVMQIEKESESKGGRRPTSTVADIDDCSRNLSAACAKLLHRVSTHKHKLQV
jgi:hypothetical protein